jgi:hypothetical protein
MKGFVCTILVQYIDEWQDLMSKVKVKVSRKRPRWPQGFRGG